VLEAIDARAGPAPAGFGRAPFKIRYATKLRVLFCISSATLIVSRFALKLVLAWSSDTAAIAQRDFVLRRAGEGRRALQQGSRAIQLIAGLPQSSQGCGCDLHNTVPFSPYRLHDD